MRLWTAYKALFPFLSLLSAFIFVPWSSSSNSHLRTTTPAFLLHNRKHRMPITRGTIATAQDDGRAHLTPKSFETTMKKSSFVSMTVPSDFVRAHGDKFHRSVYLGYNGGKPQWTVNVNVNFISGLLHVLFGAGWKNFARSNYIVQGDRVKFELKRKSCFNVTRAD